MRKPPPAAPPGLAEDRLPRIEELPQASILLVDDVPANLVALEAILEPLGQRLVKASNGPDALKAVLEHDFACILLDVQMQGMSGWETADLIKQRKRSRYTPILFLTAISREEVHVARGYQHGAVDYLLKPFDPDILRSKVAVFVDLYLMGEQVKAQAARLVEREREMAEQARKYEAERRARAAAEAAASAREEVLAVVSHDLRSPLSAVQMAAMFLRRDVAALQAAAGGDPSGPEAAAKALKQVERIERGSERMQRLIEDLLDLTRLEAGRLALKVQPTAVHTLLEHALEVFRPLAGQRLQVLREEVGADVAAARVRCDPERVFQVLSNLLGNAHKFTPEGGALTVHAFRPPGAERDTHVHFAVADTGSGMSEEQVNQLFTRYWQAQEGDRRGLGLGLTIARGIVEAHGGRVWVDSTPGKGTTFFFSLPLAGV